MYTSMESVLPVKRRSCISVSKMHEMRKAIEKGRAGVLRDCQKKKYAFEAGKSIWVHKAPVSQGIYRFKYKTEDVMEKFLLRKWLQN